jgi:hypothetical protein
MSRPTKARTRQRKATLVTAGLALTVAIGATACFNATKFNVESVNTVRTRASFDFACPESQIIVQAIATNSRDTVTTFGATGCGQRAAYVLSAQGWLLNNRASAPAGSVQP